MSSSEIKAGRIRRSIDRFSGLASDLLQADRGTFNDRIEMLVEYCRTDETISRIHQQLMERQVQDIKQWAETARTTHELRFPKDMEDRLALQYQILVAIESDQIDVLKLSYAVFRSLANNFNVHLVSCPSGS